MRNTKDSMTILASSKKDFASEALSYGYGGISIVHRATGLSRPTINFGIQELTQGSSVKDKEHIRRPGGGRKKIEIEDPSLVNALNK